MKRKGPTGRILVPETNNTLTVSTCEILVQLTPAAELMGWVSL